MSGAIDCRDLFDRQEMLDQAQFQAGDDPSRPRRHHRRPRPPAAPTPSRPATRPTTTGTPPRTSNDCAAPGTCPPSLCSVSATAPGRACLRRIAPQQGGAAGARLPLPLGIAAEAAMEQRIKANRPRWTRGPRSASQPIATGAGPEGRDRLPAGGREGRPRTRRRLGGDGHRRHHHSAGLSTRRPGECRQRPRSGCYGGPLRQRQPDDQPDTAADSLRQTDGQFVNGCSDSLNRPTPDRVGRWSLGKVYPQSAPPARSTWSSA